MHPSSPYFESLNTSKKIIEILKLHKFYIIIKPHPNEDTTIYDQYTFDNSIMISDLPSSVLIKHMNLGVFTKSAIGLEIALNRKYNVQILSNKDKENIRSKEILDKKIYNTISIKEFSNFLEQKHYLKQKNDNIFNFFQSKRVNIIKKGIVLISSLIGEINSENV